MTTTDANRAPAERPGTLPPYYPYALGATLFLAAALYLYLGLRLDLWGDEAFSIFTTSKDLSYAFSRALWLELQPPVYFVLLTIWRQIHPSFFFARLLSILLVLATLLVMAKTIKVYLKEINPLWIIAPMALHPFMVFAAVEIRCYALVLLLSALLLFLLHQGYLVDDLSPRASKRARWLYLLVAVIALYTQYYLGFLLVANAAALLATRRWAALWRYLLAMGLLALLLLPLAFIVPQQVNTHTGDQVLLPLLETLRRVYQRMIYYITPLRIDTTVVLIKWIPRLLLVALLCLLVRRRKTFFGDHAYTLLVISGVLLFIYLLLLQVLSPDLLEPRHTSFLFLALFFSLLAAARFALPRSVFIGLCLGLCLLDVTGLFRQYLLIEVTGVSGQPPFLAKHGDWRRVAEFVMAREKENQPVLIFTCTASLPFSLYYHGQNALYPLPDDYDYSAYNPARDILRDEAQIRQRIQSFPRPAARVWLVTDDVQGYLGYTFNRPLLEAFMAKHYQLELRQRFRDSEVRLLRQKDEP